MQVKRNAQFTDAALGVRQKLRRKRDLRERGIMLKIVFEKGTSCKNHIFRVLNKLSFVGLHHKKYRISKHSIN